MLRYRAFLAITTLCAAPLLVGCTGTTGDATASPSPAPYASPTAGGDAMDRAEDSAEKAGETLKEGVKQAGEAIEDAAEAVKENAGPVARDARDRAAPVVKEAGRVLDATKQHADVKAALMADDDIDASRIDVDVQAGTKTVVLRGTVPDARQKTAAERIARDKAQGYTVRNELKVGPMM